MMNGPKAQNKFCRILVVQSRRGKSKMMKKILPNFSCSAKLRPDVVMLQSPHFSRALCDHRPSLHPLEPSSGCIPLVHILDFPLYVPFVRPSRSPLTRRGPRAVRNDDYYDDIIGEDTSKGGWVGVENRVENRLKVIRTEYEGTLTKAR